MGTVSYRGFIAKFFAYVPISEFNSTFFAIIKYSNRNTNLIANKLRLFSYPVMLKATYVLVYIYIKVI